MNRRLELDLLAVDLTTCDRCVGSERNIENALELIRGVLDATGDTVEVRKTVVASAEQARELRLLSSPTIRVNGRDIALDLKESPCGSGVCACAEGPIDCRVWTYEGRDYTEAPMGLIVDAVLGELYGNAEHAASTPDHEYELPRHLASFFADRPASNHEGAGASAPTDDCCDGPVKETCSCASEATASASVGR